MPTGLTSRIRRLIRRSDAQSRLGRSKVVFVAWGAVSGRSVELAESLHGEARCFYPPSQDRRLPVLARYVLASLRTIGYLVSAGPDVVIVTNPPIFAGLIAYGWARCFGAAVVLDSHPGGFGAQGDTFSARMQPLHRWLARRVDLMIVTVESLRETVASWGGEAVIVHEAPGDWDSAPVQRHERLLVLYVGRFAADEPVDVVLDAARLAPELDILVTGDVRSCPEHLVDSAPDNVTFVGFLPADAYRSLVEDADVVTSLTTEPVSVMRAAYEAVYAKRPLLVSDWPINRELFPGAVHVEHRPEAMAAELQRIDAEYDRVSAETLAAYDLQISRWHSQLDSLVGRLNARAARR